MNTGASVADGTLYTVRLTPDGSPEEGYGEVVGADASPSIEGVQVAAAAGALDFVVAFPAPQGVYLGGFVVVYATPGTAYGEARALVPEP